MQRTYLTGVIGTRSYKVINRCNRMLANVDKIADMSTNDKEDYKAMVHFIRGYAYYVLLQNWGTLSYC